MIIPILLTILIEIDHILFKKLSIFLCSYLILQLSYIGNKYYLTKSQVKMFLIQERKNKKKF